MIPITTVRGPLFTCPGTSIKKVYTTQYFDSLLRTHMSYGHSVDPDQLALVKLFSRYTAGFISDNKGAQWLRGRVLDSRPKGRRFEPHPSHCVVVLEQDTFILA